MMIEYENTIEDLVAFNQYHLAISPSLKRAARAWSLVAILGGRAPDQIIASHRTDGKVDRTRPLCPYPQVAQYKGTGSTDEAANFVCKLP